MSDVCPIPLFLLLLVYMDWDLMEALSKWKAARGLYICMYFLSRYLGRKERSTLQYFHGGASIMHFEIFICCGKRELGEVFCALRMYKMLFKKESSYARSVPGTVYVSLPVEASLMLGIKWLSF